MDQKEKEGLIKVMKNEQELIVENWRKFVVEQTQTPQDAAQPVQTPIQQITNAAKVQVTTPGPSKETLNNLLTLIKNPRNLISLIKSGGTKLIDAFNQIKQMLTGDDFNEAAKIADLVMRAKSQIKTNPV